MNTNSFHPHPLRLACILWAILYVQTLVLCLPAQAETWVRVAKSDTTQEVQYVDADSIEVDFTDGNGRGVRLNTYWGFLDQPNSMSYATTEYRCDSAEYRDVQVNGNRTEDIWHLIGDDSLNRAAMEYGCKQAATLKTATP